MVRNPLLAKLVGRLSFELDLEAYCILTPKDPSSGGIVVLAGRFGVVGINTNHKETSLHVCRVRV